MESHGDFHNVVGFRSILLSFSHQLNIKKKRKFLLLLFAQIHNKKRSFKLFIHHYYEILFLFWFFISFHFIGWVYEKKKLWWMMLGSSLWCGKIHKKFLKLIKVSYNISMSVCFFTGKIEMSENNRKSDTSQ